MELYIAIEKFDRNLLTGRYLKGSTPHNKGKKWNDYMDKRKIKRIKRIAIKNLRPRMDIGGWNARKVVAVDAEGNFFLSPSAVKASEKTGICRRNICSCCNGKRKHAGGYRWFFEDSNEWLNLIKQ